MKQIHLRWTCMAFSVIAALKCTMAGTIHPDGLDLQEVVVAASRDSLSKLYASRQVMTFTKPLIDFSNCQNMAGILSETGRVAVQRSQQAGGSPILRGFEASRILLVVDGVRMNNLIYRSGHLQNSITVDQFMMQSVEVLPGSSSLMYGSDALGGTVVFRTRQPLLSEQTGSVMGGQAVVRYGSANNEGTAHIDFNYGTERWASLTSFTYSNFGDLRAGRNRNPFLPDDDDYISCLGYVRPSADGISDEFVLNNEPHKQHRSGYMQYDLGQKILFRTATAEEHLIDFQLSNTNNFNRYDRLSLTSVKNDVLVPKFSEWYYGPQFRLMTTYRYEGKDRLGADKVGATVAYQKVRESRHNRKFNDPLRYHTWESVDILTFNTDWINYMGAHTLHAGADAALNFLRSTAETEDLSTGKTSFNMTRYPDGRNAMHTVEAFLTHEWHINNKLKMNEGARLGYATTYSSVKNEEVFPFYDGKSQRRNKFTYSLAWGLNYLPSRTWKLAVSAASAYRVPNIDNISKFFESKLQTVTVPNAHLKPEKTASVDLNITRHVNDRLLWENVFFATYFFDAITLARGTFMGQDQIEYEGVMCDVYTSVNRRKAVLWGYSGSLSWRPVRYLTFDATYNYTYGRIVSTGETQPLDHIPPMYGRVGFSYLGFSDRLRMDVFALYNSRKRKSAYNEDGEDNIDYATVKGTDGKGMPAWYTLNLKASFRLRSEVMIQAGVENLLDTEYRTFASGINASGRNIYVAMRVGF